jgi:hypothetical protein
MMPDLDILERRVAAMRDLPWPIPAVVLLAMTDEDLDHLEAASGTDRYWPTLNRVVARIEEAGGA